MAYSMLGGRSAGYGETGLGIASALMQGLSSYYSARGARKAAQFEMEMAQITKRLSEMNARFDERTAQAILQASEINQGQIGLKAGKVKSSQKVSQAARGIQQGVGSAAEEIATTDLMQETDKMQINVDSVRKAWAARMGAVNAIGEGVNAEIRARISGATAMGTNPGLAGFTTFMSSAAPVAQQWYRRNNPPMSPTMPMGASLSGGLMSGPVPGTYDQQGRMDFMNSPYGRGF
jgi:hypothetical protein